MITDYVKALSSTILGCEVTDGDGAPLDLNEAIGAVGTMMAARVGAGNKLMFIGNGGSASICSHMSTDYSKNGGLRSLALNDGSMLTCLGNDFGYEHVFDKQIDWQGVEGDILIAISSSGASKNILNGVVAARHRKCSVITLSGFKSDNPLRCMGDMNFYLQNSEYGFVELGHLALLHTILDTHLGWKAPNHG